VHLTEYVEAHVALCDSRTTPNLLSKNCLAAIPAQRSNHGQLRCSREHTSATTSTPLGRSCWSAFSWKEWRAIAIPLIGNPGS